MVSPFEFHRFVLDTFFLKVRKSVTNLSRCILLEVPKGLILNWKQLQQMTMDAPIRFESQSKLFPPQVFSLKHRNKMAVPCSLMASHQSADKCRILYTILAAPLVLVSLVFYLKPSLMSAKLSSRPDVFGIQLTISRSLAMTRQFLAS